MARCIRLLRDELELAMALIGTRQLDQLTPDLLQLASDLLQLPPSGL